MERLGLRDYARLFELEKIIVRNFKSLRDFELPLPTCMVVVAGPNGSGKTALVEALELLRDTLEWVKGRTANPFSKWWGYRNVVYMHDEARSITIGLKLKLDGEKLKERLKATGQSEKLGENEEELYRVARELMEHLKGALEFAGANELSVHYEVSLRGLRGFTVENEILKLEAGALSVEGSFARRRLSVNINLCDLLKTERAILVVKPALKAMTLDRDLARRLVEIVESSCAEEWLSSVSRLTIEHDELMLETLWYFYDRFGRSTNWHEALIDMFESLIAESIDKALEKRREALINHLKSQAKLTELFGENGSAEQAVEILARLLKVSAHHAATVIAGAAVGVWEFIQGLIVLRGVRLSELKIPQPLTKEEALKSDGANLVPYLYTITEGKVPEQVEGALLYVLEGCKDVKLSMPVTDDGRVYISIQADGAKLPPPSQPDGALKALLIEAALPLQP